MAKRVTADDLSRTADLLRGLGDLGLVDEGNDDIGRVADWLDREADRRYRESSRRATVRAIRDTRTGGHGA